MDLSIEMTGPIIAAIVCGVAFIIFVIWAIVRGQMRKNVTGTEDMIGKIGIAKTTLNPAGQVLAEGELWTAVSKDDKIEPDDEVIITKVAGLKLWVTKNKEREEKK